MDDATLLRYSKHLLLPQIDYQGQQQLANSTVLLVGMGGLGCAVSQYLVASGIGHVILLDADSVELSNCQRQILFTAADVGQKKVQVAAKRLAALNADCQLTVLPMAADAENSGALVVDADVIVDGTDNFSSRYLLNRAAVQQQKALVSGAAIGFSGQVFVYQPTQAGQACYHCLYAEEVTESGTEACSEQGIVAPLVGIIGSMQALEVIKVLLNLNKGSKQYLQIYEGLQASWRRVAVKPEPHCSVCRPVAALEDF